MGQMNSISRWFSKPFGLWQLVRPSRQDSEALTQSEKQYRARLVRIVIVVTLTATPLIGLGYLAAYFFVLPVWPTLVLALGLFGFTPVGWFCFSLIRRGKTTQAVRAYLIYSLILTGLITALLVESLLLIGILLACLLALFAVFVEPQSVAERWVVALAAVYVTGLVIRSGAAIPTMELGIVKTAFIYAAPTILLFTIAGLGNSTIQSLRDTLRESESVRGRAEEAFKQAQQATMVATEANRLKSEFLSMMSHELRTPLNAIIGFTGIMLGGMGGKLDEDASHMVNRINSNSQHLLDLINNILDLAKVEAHQFEAVSVPFSLEDLIRHQYEQMVSLTKDKDFEFQVEIDPKLPPVIVGDKEIVQRIMSNLLTNAFKFTETGLVKLKASVNEDRSMWVMSVSDTGIGIPPHALEYIFDPFRQVDGSTSRQFGGTGLGLAIIKELAREIKGFVHADSILGEGSTFTIEIPLIIPEEIKAEMVV